LQTSKGGVGKTTISANLAAYFDLYRHKRVLLIDFDYQGSLTETLSASAQLVEVGDASARHLIQREDPPETVLDKSHTLHPALSRSRLFPCFYGFNKIENKLLLQWVTQRDGAEIRFNTHRYLSSAVFQEKFDVVIIYAPPRLMTATVNAACASNHLLIPTMLDGMSTTATLNTLGVFHELRKNLTPGLNVLGILPTFVAKREELNRREQVAMDELRQLMPGYWKSAPLPDIFSDVGICRREAIAKVAAQGLAFQGDPEVRDMFIALGDKISNRIFVDEGTEPTPSPAEAESNVTRINAGRKHG
jgi:cellulose biosynthesis protein BcsQ